MDLNNNSRGKHPINSKLKKKIINEYIYIIFTFLFLFILPFLLFIFQGDNTGIDGIGQALGIGFILKILADIIVFIFFIIKPIRILKSCKNELREILPKSKRVMCTIVIVLPILYLLLGVLSEPISNFVDNLNSYSVSYDDYKLANEFQSELIKRGFIFNENYESLLQKLNKKYENEIGFVDYKHYYYEEASLMSLSDNRFSDSVTYNSIITFNSSNREPIYIYNAILTLPTRNENLQYAPISRYHSHDYISGTFYPYYEDYYIECKILFVDGDIYAIIGVDVSWDIHNYFKNEGIEIDEGFPFYMILSEKKNITTFYNGRYYPNGAITMDWGRFEMLPNTNERIWHKNYPIRKVDKLDVETINNIAQELQNGILKKSIEYHFSK